MAIVNQNPIDEPIYSNVICCNCHYQWRALLIDGWDGKELLECPKCHLKWGEFKEEL